MTFLTSFGSHSYIDGYDTNNTAVNDVINYSTEANVIVDMYAHPYEAGNPDIPCYNNLVDELRVAVYHGFGPAVERMKINLQNKALSITVAHVVGKLTYHLKSLTENASVEKGKSAEQNKNAKAANASKAKAPSTSKSKPSGNKA